MGTCVKRLYRCLNEVVSLVQGRNVKKARAGHTQIVSFIESEDQTHHHNIQLEQNRDQVHTEERRDRVNAEITQQSGPVDKYRDTSPDLILAPLRL